MPRVKDITGDLGKLRGKKVLQKGKTPDIPEPRNTERKMAFNPSSFFFWTVIVSFVLLQFVFLLWLA